MSSSSGGGDRRRRRRPQQTYETIHNNDSLYANVHSLVVVLFSVFPPSFPRIESKNTGGRNGMPPLLFIHAFIYIIHIHAIGVSMLNAGAHAHARKRRALYSFLLFFCCSVLLAGFAVCTHCSPLCLATLKNFVHKVNVSMNKTHADEESSYARTIIAAICCVNMNWQTGRMRYGYSLNSLAHATRNIYNFFSFFLAAFLP